MDSEVIVHPRPRVEVEEDAARATVPLHERLARRIRGEVRFSDGDRALYATDGSNYRQVPLGVVLPRDAEDVIAAIAVARESDAPVLMRGGGTSLAGQCCNEALVLDTTKYFNRVVDVDAAHRRARVEPGCVLDELRRAAAPHGLTFGPDPSTHSRCALGGMIGNNSCGVHSVLAEFYGPGPQTMHQVEELDILTYDGTRFTVGPTSEDALQRIVHEGGRRAELYRAMAELRDRYADEIRRRFPHHLLRRSSGYNLDQLLPEHGFNVARALVGTESTCVCLLGATVTLIHNPAHRAILVIGYPSVFEAGDDVPRIREFRPVGLEGMDAMLIHDMRENDIHPDAIRLMPSGKGFLLVEFGGDTAAEARQRAEAACAALSRSQNPPDMRVYADAESQTKIWEVREAGLGATAFVPGKPDSWPGWEDSSVPVDKVGAYLRDLRALFDKFDYHPALYGHFGQGCIHCRVNFDLYTAAGIEKYREFTREAAHLVCDKYGGSLSGEHGDGQARGDLLPIMYGDDLVRAFHEFKAIWDPGDRMNPGKVVDGDSRTGDLRLGSDYDPAEPRTYFQFPEDEGSFARATLRCVGVGLCRRHEGGTMCPSYRVTREEKHATRGRAHLLFEMLQGEVLADGWRDEAARESLDLCLACKGCKGDCPVHVDVATYKAEFLAHYYEHRLRPRHAYAFGLIHWWARLASAAPNVANAVMHTPGVAALAKWAAGIAPQRTVPRFAPRTFSSWFRERRRALPADRAPGPRVILWPDTFNDHFFPETLAAAVEALEAVGCTVELPRAGLCCGRPLYDFGMLGQARRQLRAIMAAMRDDISAGTPVVGIEPSCVAVFRDELVNLFARDEEAKRLSGQVFMLGEFLARRVHEGATLPTLEHKAVVHAHCHHKAVMKVHGLEASLTAMKVDYTMLDSGCCGMAGAFGFERDKYDVSIGVGELVLLPAVRETDRETIVMADGFSCREQIAQTTGRRGLHLAEVVQLALHPEAIEADHRLPEDAARALAPAALRQPHWSGFEKALGAGAAAVAAGVAVRRANARK